jgi:predicted metal-dependent hydrolase
MFQKSNYFIYIITIGIVLASLYMMYRSTYEEVTFVRSSIDNKDYLVQNKSDKHEAADLLATVKGNLTKLVAHMRDKYPGRSDVKRLVRKFNPDAITESSYKNKYTSYSINKGEKIVFCLRSRDEHQKLVDLNTIMFVAIHELAHVMTLSTGHTEEFWKNFQFLLQDAVNINIYNEVDYAKKPKEYCGLTITHTPLND